MAIIEKISPERAEIILSDKFTFVDSSDFRKKLFATFDAKAKSLVIDLSQLTFMDSAGLGMMMVAHKECQQRTIPLSLLHPRGEVKSLLELTKSYDRLTIID